MQTLAIFDFRSHGWDELEHTQFSVAQKVVSNSVEKIIPQVGKCGPEPEREIRRHQSDEETHQKQQNRDHGITKVELRYKRSTEYWNKDKYELVI